jgi:hypothetical protein
MAWLATPRNAGLVDVGWTVAVAGLVVLYAAFGGDGPSGALRRAMMGAGACASSHLFLRVRPP